MENITTDSSSSRDIKIVPVSHTTKNIGRFAVAAVAIMIAVLNFGGGSIFHIVSTFLIVAFSFYHGALRYDWKRMTLFLLLVFGISWSYETLSILTGFPFGHYYYTDRLGDLRVWLVPVMIMPAYFAMGYLSWAIASILLDKRDAAVRGNQVILLPVLSSFVMVAWDMTMDPYNSTIGELWVWQNGGAYFGVPFVNFFGWYLCVFTFYMIFALMLRAKNYTASNTVIFDRQYWLLPILMYLTRTIQYVITPFTIPNMEVTSNDGHVWWTSDILRSLLLVAIFTMIFIGFYAIVRVVRSKDLIPGNRSSSS